MMNHLIIYANPSKNSFSNSILQTVLNASHERGCQVEVRDLYEIGFDPLLSSSDLDTFSHGEYPEDIRIEQSYVASADVITLIYPLWWAGLPAILKGYIDRVFAYGFAYMYINNIPTGMLSGKKALLLCTIGTSEDEYAKSGMISAIEKTVSEGIFNFCGFESSKYMLLSNVPHISDEERLLYLEKIEIAVRNILR